MILLLADSVRLLLSFYSKTLSSLPPLLCLIRAHGSHPCLSRNDPILLRRSPEVLAISTWLESPVGHYVTYTLVSIAPACAVVSDLVNNMETGLRWIAVGVIVLCSSMTIIFLVCGKSLLHAINESVRKQEERMLLDRDASIVDETTTAGMSGASKRSRSSARRDALLVARRKVKMVVFFAVTTLAKVVGILMVGLLSKYGMASPLILFLAPLGLIPPVWNVAHIQVHSKRTKLRNEMSLSTWQSHKTPCQSSPKSTRFQVHQVRVVPTVILTPLS